MMALVALYVCFGMTTAVVAAFILDAAGYRIALLEVVAFFLFWPLTLAVLFGEALGRE